MAIRQANIFWSKVSSIWSCVRKCIIFSFFQYCPINKISFESKNHVGGNFLFSEILCHPNSWNTYFALVRGNIFTIPCLWNNSGNKEEKDKSKETAIIQNHNVLLPFWWFFPNSLRVLIGCSVKQSKASKSITKKNMIWRIFRKYPAWVLDKTFYLETWSFFSKCSASKNPTTRSSAMQRYILELASSRMAFLVEKLSWLSTTFSTFFAIFQWLFSEDLISRMRLSFLDASLKWKTTFSFFQPLNFITPRACKK